MRSGAWWIAWLAWVGVVASLGAGLGSRATNVGAAEEVVRLGLVAAALEAPERVPPELALELTSPGFAALGPAPKLVELKKGTLTVDWDGDGRPDTSVRPGKAEVVRWERPGGAVRVLVYERAGRGWAAPAEVLRGVGAKAGAWRLELLDADLDGRFDGPADRVRVGEDGGFFVPAVERRVARGDELWRLELVRSTGATPPLQALLTREPHPKGVGATERRGLAAVNAYRNRVGLAPLALDMHWCDGCAKHAAYILRNPVQGFGHEQLPNLPGYTPEGHEAAREGVMERTGDPAAAVERLTAMLMHRTPFLTDPRVGLGVGAVGPPPGSVRSPGLPGGGTPAAPGFSVLRAGKALASSAWPVFVPGPGQVDVPLQLLPEVPIPEPRTDLYARPRGYAVSVSFLPASAGPVRLTLRTAVRGEAVACILFTPSAPLHPAFAHNYATAFLVPEQPLSPSTTYEAECRVGEGTSERLWLWRFVTGER